MKANKTVGSLRSAESVRSSQGERSVDEGAVGMYGVTDAALYYTTKQTMMLHEPHKLGSSSGIRLAKRWLHNPELQLS